MGRKMSRVIIKCHNCKKEYSVINFYKSKRKYCCLKCYYEQEKINKLGNKNPMWKGDTVGCGKLHEWIKRHKPKKELCECCNTNKSYDLANISGEYKRDINDFEWLCRSCHMRKDGRMKQLKQYKQKGDSN